MEATASPSFVFQRLLMHSWNKFQKLLAENNELSPIDLVSTGGNDIREKLRAISMSYTTKHLLNAIIPSFPVLSKAFSEKYGNEQLSESISEVQGLYDDFKDNNSLEGVATLDFDELLKSTEVEDTSKTILAWTYWTGVLVSDQMTLYDKENYADVAELLMEVGTVMIKFAIGLNAEKLPAVAQALRRTWTSIFGVLSAADVDVLLDMYDESDKEQLYYLSYIQLARLTIGGRELRVFDLIIDMKTKIFGKKPPKSEGTMAILDFLINILENNDLRHLKEDKETRISKTFEDMWESFLKLMKNDDLKERCLSLLTMILLRCSNEHLVAHVESYLSNVIIKLIWQEKYTLTCLKSLLSLLRGRLVADGEYADAITDKSVFELVMRKSSTETISKCLEIINAELFGSAKKEITPTRLHFTLLWKIIVQMAAFNTAFVVQKTLPLLFREDPKTRNLLTALNDLFIESSKIRRRGIIAR